MPRVAVRAAGQAGADDGHDGGCPRGARCSRSSPATRPIPWSPRRSRCPRARRSPRRRTPSRSLSAAGRASCSPWRRVARKAHLHGSRRDVSAADGQGYRRLTRGRPRPDPRAQRERRALLVRRTRSAASAGAPATGSAALLLPRSARGLHDRRLPARPRSSVARRFRPAATSQPARRRPRLAAPRRGDPRHARATNAATTRPSARVDSASSSASGLGDLVGAAARLGTGTLVMTGGGSLALAAGGPRRAMGARAGSRPAGRAQARSGSRRGLPSAGVLLSFDDGPHPEGTPAVLAGSSTVPGRLAVFFVSGEQVSNATRSSCPRSPLRATRSPSTATGTKPAASGAAGLLADDTRPRPCDRRRRSRRLAASLPSSARRVQPDRAAADPRARSRAAALVEVGSRLGTRARPPRRSPLMPPRDSAPATSCCSTTLITTAQTEAGGQPPQRFALIVERIAAAGLEAASV